MSNTQEGNHVSTGIDELDEILGGGFLKGQIILLAGNPGSGKTTFGVQFIYDGLRKEENGVFVGLVEPKDDFMSYMEKMGFNLKKFEEEGRFVFIEALTTKDKESLEVLIKNILEVIRKINAKRLVIDSISAIESLFTHAAEIRSFLHNVLLHSLKKMNVTSIIISDLPYGATIIGLGIEEFIFDGVITLEQKLERGLPRRRLVIRKLRGKSIPTSHYDFNIGVGGIKLIPPLIFPLEGTLGDEMFSTGVKELDEMLGGGLRKGSTTIVVGPSGSGKTMLAVSFIVDGLEKGEKCLYISYEESSSQIMFYLRKFNIEEDKMRNLKIISRAAIQQTPYETYNHERKEIEEYKPHRIVLDGLTALKRIYSEEDFSSITRSLVSLCKKEGLTFLMTLIGDPFKEKLEISTIADNIIALTLERIGDRLVRKIGVIKARGSMISDVMRKLSFDERGRIIVGD